MEFAHVTISVKNLDESLEFYQNVIGLPIKRRFSSGESELVFSECVISEKERCIKFVSTI